MSASRKQIQEDLRFHLESEGTANDSTTDELYREWHNIPEGQETVLEEVEKWASDVYSGELNGEPNP